MLIRTDLAAGDLTFIQSVHANHYVSEYGYGASFERIIMTALCEYYDTLPAGRNCHWIVEENGKREGCLVLQDRGQVAQLRMFYLRPTVRGRGVGRQLLDALIASARRIGHNSIYLWTTDEQTAAINLYCAAGFVLVEERVSNIFDRTTNDQRYELQLLP